MKQRKFEIRIEENLNRDDGTGAAVSMRIAKPEGGNVVYEWKYENAALAEEQIVEAVNKLVSYFLPEVPAKEVEAPETVAVFKRTPDGKFVRS